MRITSWTNGEGYELVDVFLTMSAEEAHKFLKSIRNNYPRFGIIGVVDATGKHFCIQVKKDGSAYFGRKIVYHDKTKMFNIEATFREERRVTFGVRAESEEEAIRRAKDLAEDYKYSSDSKTEVDLIIEIAPKSP